jgi:hypothetical protein
MSCDGWGVGDKCKCIASFLAIERQIGGPDRVTRIEKGYEGRVTQKIDRVPHSHLLYVFWNQLNRNLPVQDEQIKNLSHV